MTDPAHRQSAPFMTPSAASPANPDIPQSPAARPLRGGMDHLAAGRIDEAIAAFRRGLADAEDESPRQTSAKIVAELHFKLGNAALIRGDLDMAAENYKTALRLAPDMPPCWCNLGNVHLKLNPPPNQAQALIATQQTVIAKALLIELADERPQDAQIRSQLGKLHAESDELEDALDCFQRALSLNPDDADSLYWIGGIRQKIGDHEGAEVAYGRAARLEPLLRRPATQFPAEFRVLALFAPFAGNTPTEFLLTGATYDANTLAVFDGRDYDLDLLPRSGHVVVNLISDADQAQALFPLVTDLVDRLGLPTVNPPRKVQQTPRDMVARL